jgi:hypothetical protein
MSSVASIYNPYRLTFLLPGSLSAFIAPGVHQPCLAGCILSVNRGGLVSIEGKTRGLVFDQVGRFFRIVARDRPAFLVSAVLLTPERRDRGPGARARLVARRPGRHGTPGGAQGRARAAGQGHQGACLQRPEARETIREADFGEAKAMGDRCGICRAYGGRDKCTKVLPPMDEDDWCAVGVAKSNGRWFSGNDRWK